MTTAVSARRRRYSIVVLGRGGVGKSALILRFLYDEFVEDYEPTKADCYQKKMTLKSHGEVVLDILDTAGEELYPSVREHYIRSADGFLLVFSTSDQSSLDALKELNEEILRVRCGQEQVPRLVVGTKCELCAERKVPTEEVEALCRQLDVALMETSARTQHNVEEVFVEITRQMKAQKAELVQPEPQPPRVRIEQSTWKRKFQILHTSARRNGKKINVTIKSTAKENGQKLQEFMQKKKAGDAEL